MDIAPSDTQMLADVVCTLWVGMTSMMSTEDCIAAAKGASRQAEACGIPAARDAYLQIAVSWLDLSAAADLQDAFLDGLVELLKLEFAADGEKPGGGAKLATIDR